MKQRKRKQVLPVNAVASLYGSEKAFALLVAVLGYTAGDAYQMAFDTKANKASACSMASKLLTERRMQAEIQRLADYYSEGLFAFNDKFLIFK